MASPHRRAFRTLRRGDDDARAGVDDELAFHLEMATRELMADGRTEDEARREATRLFGDLETTRRRLTEVQSRLGRRRRRGTMFDELRQDLKTALRSLRASPGYAALVVATLAFGITADTVVFSAMNPYMLRPLPYGHPDELVQLNVVNPVTGWDMDRLSWPEYQDWKARTRAFTGLAAYNYGTANVTDAEGPERIDLSRVTADMLDVLQAKPLLGRGFVPADGRPGGEDVVVLAESLWRRRYNADPHILGRTVTMDGVRHTVVGVMPASFNFPFGSVRMWVPIREDATASRSDHDFILVGRLAPGWTRSKALVELNGIHGELARLYPDTDGKMSGVTVWPLRQALNFAWNVLRVSFTILLGAVFFVLLIACVNVATLTLARGGARARELAVRASLGAGRGRLVRQLLVESLVLAVAGGALGIGLSWWLAGLIDPVIPGVIYRVGAIDIDGKVLAFSLVLTVLTAVAFGLLPALRASRVDLTTALKGGGRSGAGPAAARSRRMLVVAQVTLAVVLVSGAGLMMRSFVAVRALDLGFAPSHVVVAEVHLPAVDHPGSPRPLEYMNRAVTAMADVPGVDASSAASFLPMNHELFTTQVVPPEMASLPAQKWPLAAYSRVAPDYFHTMGMKLLQGRDFTSADRADAPAVAVVSGTLARRFWPDGNALGKTVLIGDDPEHARTITVVGVTDEVRMGDLDQDNPPLQIYLPLLQGSSRRFFLLARTGGAPGTMVATLRTALRSADPDLPLDVRPMSEVVRESHLQWIIGTVFMGSFGLGAIFLATLGIYGLVAYSVSQRRREMGVRIALGAPLGEIRRRVVADGLRLTGIGLVLGLGGAAVLARMARAALYGVSPFDPLTLGAVLVIFLAVSTLAALAPARRAARIDPADALRSE